MDKRQPGSRHDRPSAESRVQIAGHPLHPMLVTFPIAFFSATLATDIIFWWSGNPLWALFSFWLLVGGLLGGFAAAATGFLDFLLVPAIRHYFTSWSHMLSAILLMALAAANLLQRWNDPTGMVLPWGLFLSLMMMAMVGVSGWLGGKLVFEHNLGPKNP